MTKYDITWNTIFSGFDTLDNGDTVLIGTNKNKTNQYFWKITNEAFKKLTTLMLKQKLYGKEIKLNSNSNDFTIEEFSLVR